MANLTQTRLKEILTKDLKLCEPRFALRKYGTQHYGSVISETFTRKGDYDRQLMIRNALERVLGPTFQWKVGMILAYTPFEWDIDLDEVPMPKKSNRG